MFSFNVIVLLAAISQLSWSAPIVVDRSEAEIAANTAKRLAVFVKHLQDFEIEMLASVPVTNYLNTIFESMKNVKEINIESTNELKGEVFDELATIQVTSTMHAERLGQFIYVLNSTAEELYQELVETFEVASFIQTIEDLFYELSGEMMDILVAVETQIGRTEIGIRNLINGIDDDDYELPKIRKTLVLLDKMYSAGNKELIIVLDNIQTESELLLNQLRILLRDNEPDLKELLFWQRKHLRYY